MPYMNLEQIDGEWICVWERTRWQKIKERFVCSHKGHIPSKPIEMVEMPNTDQTRLHADSVSYCCRCMKALSAKVIDKGPYVYEPLILPAVR